MRRGGELSAPGASRLWKMWKKVWNVQPHLGNLRYEDEGKAFSYKK